MRLNLKLFSFIFLLPVLCLVSVGVYFLPPVHDRLAWRVDEVILNIKYRLNPPAQAVFVPQGVEEDLPTATTAPVATASATP